MEKKVKILILIVFILIGGAFYFLKFSKKSEKVYTEISQQKLMKLKSPAFGENQPIPKKYTCDAENINPPLEIEGVPEKAKSLVLIVDDLDTPGGGFSHWVVWNIDPKISKIEENSKPGIEGINDFGENSYGGPCPPFGVHRYRFKIYALDTLLEISTSSKKTDVEKSIQGHVLDFAQLVGTYQR
jgi:Raf kinase inhibitor-like YbhB/YbcL family protein